MPSSTADLLDELQASLLTQDERPWGVMSCLNARGHDLTIKLISIGRGKRTSLQYHEYKDELLIILDDFNKGFVQLDEEAHILSSGRFIRVKPGTRHRVYGPMEYLEVSTYDNNDDTVRVEDDWGRTRDDAAIADEDDVRTRPEGADQ